MGVSSQDGGRQFVLVLAHARWSVAHVAGVPAARQMGEGVSLCFQCEDAVALYREFQSRGIEAAEPFVGNSMWVTVFSDPDGYKLDFESPTNVAEETKLSEVEA